MSVSALGNQGAGSARPLATDYRRSRQALDMQRQYGPEQSHTRCLGVKGDLVNEETGETFAVLCRNARCVACNRLTYRKDFRDAVRLARPSHMVTITGLSGGWQQDHPMLNRLFRRLTRRGDVVHLVYAVEPNPQGTGFHAHGWMYDSISRAGIWTEQARAVGLGLVMVTRVTHERDFAYPVKATTWNNTSLTAFRQANGPQRHHMVGQFWRDARTGEVFRAYEDAAVAWRGLPRQDRSNWFFQPRSTARLSALTPRAAQGIRARLVDQQGRALVSVATGEYLSQVGPPVSHPLGVGKVGPIRLLVRQPDRLLLLHQGALVQVSEVAA